MPTYAKRLVSVVVLALGAGLPAQAAMGAGACAGSVPAGLAWTRIAPSSGAPAPRSESAAAVVGHRLFVIGGRGALPLDIFDMTTRRWTQGAPPPVELSHFQAAVAGSRIYVTGALNGSFPQEHIVPRILIYDTVADRWSEGPALTPNRARGAAASVVHGGYLYLVGGNRLGHNSGYVPWFDRLDLRTGSWTRLPDAPRARDHFQAVVTGGMLYAPGGRTSAVDRNADISLTVPRMDIYNLRSGRWTTAQAPIPTPRAGLSAVVIDGMIITAGGESATQKVAHAEVEAYYPKNGGWCRLPPLPVGRNGAPAVVVGRTIHIVGGSLDSRGGREASDHWMLSGF